MCETIFYILSCPVFHHWSGPQAATEDKSKLTYEGLWLVTESNVLMAHKEVCKL